MKQSVTILMLLMLVWTCGCSDTSRRGTGVHWQSTNSEFDSTVDRLEHTYINNSNSRERQRLTQRVCTLARRHADDKVMQAQSLYWSARNARQLENDSLAEALLSRASALIDSAANPYEWARIRSQQSSLRRLPLEEQYRLAKSTLQVFESAGDSMMMAGTLVRLGTILLSVSDTASAAKYYSRAGDIYSDIGLEQYHLRNLLNLATTFNRTPTLHRRDSIMQALRENREARADSSFYHIVMFNSFSHTGHFPYMREAYAYISGLPGREGTLATYESNIAGYYLANNLSLDSVGKYARMAYSRRQHVVSAGTMADICNAMAATMRHEGKPDSVLYFTNQYMEYSLQWAKELYSIEINKAENQSILRGVRQEEQQRLESARMTWLVITAALVMLAIGILLWFYFRTQRAKLRTQRAELELQRNANYLSAYAVDIEQKDSLIGAILNDIQSLKDQNKIGDAEARSLSLTIRHYMSTRTERESFQKMHEQLHPEFIRGLKRDYPSLGESHLRLAAYISLGLSNKQIAQTLNIEYDSVKKSRYRLRSKMGLQTGESLEDALRRYTR